jgi:hypothetical protein
VSELDTDDLAPRSARFSDKNTDDAADGEDLADAIPARGERRKAADRVEREGLPPGYRMRADAHYVDQLSARSHDVPMRLVSIEDIDAPDATEHLDSVTLQPLVQSIAEHGLLQPLLVRRDGGRYRLIAGHNRLVAARAAGVPRLPCLVHTADEAQADALRRASQVQSRTANDPAPSLAAPSHVDADVNTSVSEALATIRTSGALLSGDASAMARRIALDLVQAEAWRASWQLRAAAILRNTHRWKFRATMLSSLLGHVRDGFAAERRLRGIEVKLDVGDWNMAAHLDEEAVVCGLSGAIVATAGVLAGLDDPQVTLLVRRPDGKALTIEIAQDAIVLDASVVERFFDPTWSDHPGGRAGGIGAAAARAVAERHGGAASLIVGLAAGSTVRLTLGRASPAASRH